MKKRKLHLKKKNICFLIIILFSGGLIFYHLTSIINWFFDNDRVTKELKEIKEETAISEKKVISDQEEDKPSFDPYWDFIKTNYMEVDFSNLNKMNEEVVAWILVNGTNINYPVVQHNDNEYYLSHSFSQSKNEAGWVFMDYRNQDDNFQKNTIIYAHGRKNGSMFGSLKNILNSSWYKNSNNYIVKLSTLYENSLWQVFSIYKIRTTNDYIQTDFSTDDSFLSFLDNISSRSIYNFQTTVNASDKVLTLSTCFNDDEKIVLHAKLIESQKRSSIR